MATRSASRFSARSRALAVAAAVAGGGGLAGCDWSLSFEQNMLDLAEELICPGCKPKNGNDGGGAGSGGSGGGAAGAHDAGEADAGDARQPGEAKPRAIIAIGGRTWDIDGLGVMPATGDPKGATVALLASLNLSGAVGEAVILLPRGEWPVKDDGTPWAFNVGTPPATRDGTGGLRLGGKKYTIEFVSSTARLDDTPGGPRLRGSIETHVKADPPPAGNSAAPQLLKVSFDLPAE